MYLSFLPMVFWHFHNSHISLISPYPTSYKLAWEVSLSYIYIYIKSPKPRICLQFCLFGPRKILPLCDAHL